MTRFTKSDRLDMAGAIGTVMGTNEVLKLHNFSTGGLDKAIRILERIETKMNEYEKDENGLQKRD